VKTTVIAIASGFVVPCVTLVTACLLCPFWDWVETKYGVESLGHSGPALWCYAAVLVTYGVIGIAALVFWKWRTPKR